MVTLKFNTGQRDRIKLNIMNWCFFVYCILKYFRAISHIPGEGKAYE